MPGFLGAERCTVTALTRRDLAEAARTAIEYGIPHAYDSTEAICSSGYVDAVLVTTPDALHLPDTLTSVEHAIPVLCEKPMAMNAGEAAEMVRSARNAHVTLGVAHVFRFEESVRRFRERVAAGDLGRPRSVRSEFHYPATESPRAWITDPGLACGGPIADVGVHCVDALRFVLEDEVAAVSATAEQDDQSRPLESSAELVLDFRSGMSGRILVSGRRTYRTFLKVEGEEGVISAVDAFSVDHPVKIEFRRHGSDEVVVEDVSNEHAYARQVDAFAAAIEEGIPFDAPGDEGLQNQQVIDAAYRSLETGRKEQIGVTEGEAG